MRVMNEDFIAGMLFNRIEHSIDKFDNNIHPNFLIKGSVFNFDASAENIPLWSCGTFKDTFIENVCQIVTDFFIEKYEDDFELHLKREFPYKENHIKIAVHIKKKNKTKEMTISEIEEQLGYKIKIINEKEV
jgi:hypothetical protein